MFHKLLPAWATLIFFASPAAHATVTFGTAYSGTAAEVSSATQFTYAADVSDFDLLHGITAAVTGWNTGNNAHPSELTDGIHGVGFDEVGGDKVQGAWTTVGATAEYDLGVSSGGAGWDITSVQSIADWINAGFGNQAWALQVKPVGGNYATLATVDYQPLGSGGGTTKVTLTDSSGVLATGIQSIKVTANAQSGHESGAFVWRELDVFGVPTSDDTAPTLDTLTSVIPTNVATEVPLAATVPLRIMPLGDSITAGYTDGGSWEKHPFKFGYRSGLYTRLSNRGYNFVLVGDSTEPWNEKYGDPTKGGTFKPAFDLRDIGQDGHNGYGGKRASFLNAHILTWLANDDPDIILLKIGTNAQDQNGLQTLVDTITTTKPECHLIIAQIMPKFSYQQGIVDYNTWIRDTLVPAQQALGRNVSIVDQYAPFLTNPDDLTSIDQSLFSNGINHPDNDGYDLMAQAWLDGIEQLGIGPSSFGSWIGGFPGVGVQTEPGDDPDGDGISNGLENFFGTDPSVFSRGQVAGAVDAGTSSLAHPQNLNPAPELTATYLWSTDLKTFQNDGDSAGGTTMNFSAQPNTPQTGVSTVLANVSGIAVDRLFAIVRLFNTGD